MADFGLLKHHEGMGVAMTTSEGGGLQEVAQKQCIWLSLYCTGGVVPVLSLGRVRNRWGWERCALTV